MRACGIINLLLITSISGEGASLRKLQNATVFAADKISVQEMEDAVSVAADAMKAAPYNMTDFDYLETPVSMNNTSSEPTPVASDEVAETTAPETAITETPTTETTNEKTAEVTPATEAPTTKTLETEAPTTKAIETEAPTSTKSVAAASKEQTISQVDQATPTEAAGGCGKGCIAAAVVCPIVGVFAIVGIALFVRRRRRRRAAEYNATESFDPVF